MARTISSKLPEIGGTVVSSYFFGRFAIVQGYRYNFVLYSPFTR